MAVRKLNLIQIHLRQRALDGDEIETLESIVAEEQRDDILAGAYLLLGDQQKASEHFEKMTKETQDCFKEFPIFRFWDSAQ